MAKTKSGSQTIFWWIMWILLTIGSFFAAAYFWTPFVAAKFGSVRETRNGIIWVALVFGSWMVLLVPLIIVMYQKVDKAYEDARIRREKIAAQFRSVYVDKNKRTLSPQLSSRLSSVDETIPGGHVVTALLKGGQRVPNLFIRDRSEILGIYDQSALAFEAGDIQDIEPADPSKLPAYNMMTWLRLDGVKPE